MRRARSTKWQAWQDMKAADHDAAVLRAGRIYVPRRTRVVPPRIFEGQQREHIIDQIKVELSRWRSSKFEHEADCRHGLRSGLCSVGHHWDRADQESERIVLEALNRMGARRPTWEQGQRGYVESEDNCRWCGQPLPEDMAGSRHSISFCCEEHAKLARQHWGFEHRRQADKTFMRVVEAVYRAKAPPRACAHCGKPFRSHKAYAKYCSQTCAGLAQQRHQCECALCGTIFTSNSPNVRFCSPVHRTQFNQMRKGTWRPKKLSPVVFDFYVTVPANSAPPLLLPERFDELLAMAA